MIRHTGYTQLLFGLFQVLLITVFAPVMLQADEIRVVFPDQPQRGAVLRTFYLGNIEYINTQELADIFSAGAYVNDDVDKQVIYFREGEIKITAFSSFVVIGDQAYQMPAPSYFDGQNYFVPARSLFTILGLTVLKGSRYDEARRAFIGPPSLTKYNIHSASVGTKQNGTLIRVKTSKQFDGANIERYITDGGWLVVVVPGGIVDSVALAHSTMGGIIREAVGHQLAQAAELRFKLTAKVSPPEVYQVAQGAELHIAIRNPVRRPSGDRTKQMREQWHLDTIVLDPGHGGKDGGTVGRGGLKEKTVTLDVALRLGRLIKRNSNMRVVYTRDEDVFVPLFQRTKIANENDGKLFISIHVNSAESRSAHGFETWFLAPANTPEAIAIAQRENSAILLEESNHRYQEFSDEALILSTMAHSTWMRESEDLGAIIQSQLPKRLEATNRGIKQTGFIVLIGASMPKILVEIGFISNRMEEKKLGQNAYRQRIAEGLLGAIMTFKKKYEVALLKEQ